MTDKQKGDALYGIVCDEFQGEQNNPFFKYVRLLFLLGEYVMMADVFDYIWDDA